MQPAMRFLTSLCLSWSLMGLAHAEETEKTAPAPSKSDTTMAMPHGKGPAMPGMSHGGPGMGMGMGPGMMAHGKGGPGMGMMGMNDAQMTEHLRGMQEHMLMMHDLSNKILAETDATKKQALKDQQIELMKAHHQQMMSKMMGHSMGKSPSDMMKHSEKGDKKATPESH